MKALFIILGSLSLTLGIIGIFVPGLPTTPFLLLTAALYLRGSEKLYNRVVSHPILGNYIRHYQSRKGLTLKNKIITIILMWIMILLSCHFFITNSPGRITLVILGVVGTVVMGYIIRTVRTGV